jgi:hypothetical protein
MKEHKREKRKGRKNGSGFKERRRKKYRMQKMETERKYSHLRYTYSKPLNVRRDVNHTN